MIVVRKADELDLPYIAEIHKRSYSPEHLTRHYSIGLLIRFYREILHENEYCYVATLGDRPVGFLFAGKRTRLSVNSFLRKNYLSIGLVVLSHPSFISSSLRGLVDRLTSKESSVQAGVKLLSIAADALTEKVRIGENMLLQFEEDLMNNSERFYGLSVRTNNKRAIEFYKRNELSVVDYLPKSIVFEKKL